ncbi:MAG TPA: hypothetical protein VNS34_10535 [Rhizobiaceae bacterium]|nr:hypothetical protein [Rhizobiaceae bacterium]
MIRTQPTDEHGLALDTIHIDGGTQSRATLNEHVIEDVPLALIAADTQAQPRKYIKTDVWKDYQEAMERGDIFPPVTVFHDGSKYWLADGFHRVYAARGIGRTEIRCEIHQGGLRDAVLYSVGVNHAHGLQRTDADRRRAIMRLLEDEEWGAWSDREIARRCKVHHTTVARVKADIRAFYRGEARDAGGKFRPGREAVFDDPRVERITGDVASDSRGRKFRSKHGTVATMKTAGINASRKNAPRPSISDEPSPEAGPQAEASLAGTGTGTPADREGRHEGEAASADLPTNLRNIFDELVALWTEATDEDREAFIAYLRVSGVIFTESNPATGTGGDDVDRRAERASSAVKVGATNLSGESRERQTVGTPPSGANPISKPEAPSMDGARKGPSGTAAEKYQAQVTRQPEGERSTDGEAVVSPAPRNSQMPANPAASPARQATAAPEVAPPPASGATLSKADMIRRIRPFCQHLDDLEKCGGTGREHCGPCKKLMAEKVEAA